MFYTKCLNLLCIKQIIAISILFDLKFTYTRLLIYILFYGKPNYTTKKNCVSKLSTVY